MLLGRSKGQILECPDVESQIRAFFHFVEKSIGFKYNEDKSYCGKQGVSLKTVISGFPREDRLSFLAMLITLILSPFLSEYIGPIFTLVTFVIFKLQCKKSGRQIEFGMTGKMMFVYMGYMILSAMWSDNPIMSVLIGLLWMGMFLGALTVSNLATTEYRLDTMIYFAVIGGAFVGAIALIQTLALYADLDFPNPFWGEIDAKVLGLLPGNLVDTNFVLEKPASTFTNSLIFATFMLVMFPFSLYSTVTQKGGRRVVSGVCVLIYFVSIASTYSRGAYLAIIVALFVLMFLGRNYALNIGITFVAVLAVLPSSVFRRLSEVSVKDFAVGERFKIWGACFDIFSNNFFLGIGAGSDNLHQRLVNDYAIHWPHAHNLYFEIMVEGGVVGLLLIGAVLAFIVKDCVKIISRGGKWKIIGMCTLSAVAGLMTMSLTEFTFQTPKELQVVMVVMGFLEAALRLSARAAERGEKAKKIVAAPAAPARIPEMIQ